MPATSAFALWLGDVTTPAPVSRSVIHGLQRTLALAADAQLAEVVSLVDAMPDRGEADSLLAPFRGRLLQIRPQRKLGVNRLLFIPVDSIIVPALQWRRKSPTIPRSALGCLASQIRAGLAPFVAAIEAEIGRSLCDDRKLVQSCGARLWPLAADVLAQGPMPDDWVAMTGLAEADHAAIAYPLAVLLRQGAAMEVMVQSAARDCNSLTVQIRSCLTAATTSIDGDHRALAPLTLGMLITVLLGRLPAADQVLTVAGNLATALSNPAPRLAADIAIAFMLDGMATPPGRQDDLSAAASELVRLADLLDTLDRAGAAGRPSCKTRVAELRRDTDIACRARFETQLDARLLDRANTINASASDETIAGRETAALDLRRLESAGRLFGGGGHYDSVLKLATRTLIDSAPTGSSKVDLARVVEILQGPEAALALL